MWRLPLWAHAAALVVLVIALAPLMRLDGPAWTEEEGRLGLQVEALRSGGWEHEYAGASLDPEQRWAPIVADPAVPGAVGDGEVAPAPGHPAYVRALVAVAGLVGTGAALFLVPLAGVVLAAVAAWLLADELEPKAARPAFWLVAASPLLISGYVLWPVTLVGAVGGWALVAALRIARVGLSIKRGVGLAGALAVGAVLAPAAVFFGIAVAMMLAAWLVWRRRFGEAAATTVIAIGAALGAFAASQLWVGSIVGGWPGFGSLWADPGGGGLGERLETRIAAAWRFLLDGGNVVSSTEWLTVAAVLAALAGGLFLRLRGSREARVVGAGVAVVAAGSIVVLAGIRSAEAPTLPVLGLVAAWPVVVLALATHPWRETTSGERFVIAAVVLTALVVVLMLPNGGSEREWGGRLLAPVVVPLGALTAVALVRRLASRPWEQQTALVVAVVLLAAFPTSRGLESVRAFRASSAEVDSALSEVAADTVVIDNPRLARTPIFSWRLDDEIDWYVSYGDIDGLLAALADQGVDQVALLPDPTRESLSVAPYEAAKDVTPPALEARGLYVFTLQRLASTGIHRERRES